MHKIIEIPLLIQDVSFKCFKIFNRNNAIVANDT